MRTGYPFRTRGNDPQANIRRKLCRRVLQLRLESNNSSSCKSISHGWAGLFCHGDFNLPGAFKVDEICFHSKTGNCRPQILRRTGQFALMMSRLGCGISLEPCQPAIAAAIGMKSQNDPLRSMKIHRLLNLLDNEGAVTLAVWRSQSLGRSGDPDGVRIRDSQSLEEFGKSGIETAVKTPDDSRVAYIPLTRRLEVEYFFHKGLLGTYWQLSYQCLTGVRLGVDVSVSGRPC